MIDVQSGGRPVCPRNHVVERRFSLVAEPSPDGPHEIQLEKWETLSVPCSLRPICGRLGLISFQRTKS